MSPPPRILVLTASHLCRNPRVLKEATTLGEAGYSVTVLSVSVRQDFERLDLDLMSGRPFRRITLDYTGATPASRAVNFLQRGATWAARRLCRELGIETPQSLGPAGALLRHARRFPADLIIAHTEIPLWAATRLLREGRRVAVDLEDWYSEDLLPEDRRSRPIRLLRVAEAFVLRHAAYCSATSRSMASALAEAHAAPLPVVIRNTFPLQPHARTDATVKSRHPRLIWFSQTVGPGRGLEAFLAAWADTSHPAEVHLLGDVRPGYRASLLDSLPPERRDWLHFHSPVAPDALPGRLAEYDVGLALEAATPLNRDVTITNKILQYLNAGLAVIATNTAGQREVLQAAPDCGILLSGQAATHAGQIDALVGDAVALRRAQRAARQAAMREFCWEQECPRLLDAVARALAHPRPSPSV